MSVREARQGASGACASPARARPPLVTGPVAATERERAPPPEPRPAGPPHLDLPTPLSPMMRIFRVVSTSSSILTLVGSEPRRPCVALNPSPGRAPGAPALLRGCHLLFTAGN